MNFDKITAEIVFKAMKLLLAIIIFSALPFTKLQAQTIKLVEKLKYVRFNVEEVHKYFKELSIEDNNLRLVAAATQVKLTTYLNGVEIGPFDEGKVFKIPLPLEYGFEAYGRDGNIAISPLPFPFQNRGFYISTYASPEFPSVSGNVHTFDVTVQLSILLIGEYGKGIKLGPRLYLIGSDFDVAKRLLERR